MDGTATPAKFSYRPALDGVRGLAIAAVVVFHGHLGLAPGGFLGVDLFFVLSGFLITTLLAQEFHNQGGLVRWRRFYLRRAARLFPALGLFLACCLAIEWFRQEAPLPMLLRSLAGVACYGFNLMMAAGWAVPLALSHLWSLSVEEQFYLVWPWVLIWLLRHRGRGTALLTLAWTWVVFLLWTGPHPNDWVYFGSDTRAAELLLGCCLGLVPFNTPSGFDKLQRLCRPLMWPALAVFALTVVFVTHLPLDVGLVPAIVAMGILVFGAAWQVHPGVDRLLSVRPLVGLGKISYSLYLWHAPLSWWLEGNAGPSPWRMLVAIGAGLAMAGLSYRYIERPWRARSLAERPPDTGVR